MKNGIKRVIKVISHPSYLSWFIQTRLLLVSKRWLGFSRKRTKAQQTRVIMFHLGRSGSTVLADLLNQHSDIFWDGEIAKPILNINSEELNSRLDKFQELFSHGLSKSKGHQIYGCEIKPFHIEAMGLTFSEMISYFDEQGVTKYIVLERKNHLRKIVSSVAASATGTWHKPKGAENIVEKITLPLDDVNIDGKRQSLLTFLSGYEENMKDLRGELSNHDVLDIYYEDDLLESPSNAAIKCFDHFGIHTQTVNVRYGRTNPLSIKELVINYSDLERTLKGTTYEWMLNS
ncbi:MAG: hypothetical protein WED00_11505 [Aquisalimonadaceae bacterium]